MNEQHQQAPQGAQDDDLSELVWWASVDSHTDQTIFLYRKEAGQLALLDKLSVDEETMPTLEDFKYSVKELHGGGIYEAAIRTPKGQLAKRVNFSLSGLPKKLTEAVQAAPSENSQEKLLALLIQQGQQQQSMFLAGLEKIGQAIAAKPEKPDIDPFELMERAANILSKNGATPTPPKSLIEQASELIQLKELFGGLSSDGNGDGWGSITAALAPLAEMMKENTINERLKLELANKAQQQKALAQKAKAAQAAPVPTNSNTAFLNDLKSVLVQVLPYAEQGADPQAVAMALVNAVPNDKLSELYTFLQNENSLADMANLEPKIEQYWDWFTQLANALIEQIDAKQGNNEATNTTAAPIAHSTPQPQAANSNGQTGDAPNLTANGKASPRRTNKRPSAPVSPTAS